jgi:hypothetical protein
MKVVTMHQAKTFKRGFASLLFIVAVAVSGSLLPVSAQEKQKEEPAARKVTNNAGRDPFKKYEPPRGVARNSGQILVPTIQERIDQYRAQKAAAMNAHAPAPKPTTALLLSEVQVVGISRTPRGYAAIVEATPIKLSYVIYPGERFYDGQLVAIEDTRLVFRHERVFGDGKRERSVEMKSLRQPSAADAMTAVKAAPASAPVADSDKKPEKVATDKP